MRGPEVINIVVIDDVCRYAIHVWRHLGKSIGAGIGDIYDDDTDRRYWKGDFLREPLETPDGRARIWWVPADGLWEHQFVLLSKRITWKGSVFLIDVRGSSLPDSAETLANSVPAKDRPEIKEKFEPEAVLSYLEKKQIPQKDMWVVSSYRTGTIYSNENTVSYLIKAKSPEVLRILDKEIHPPTGHYPSPSLENTHHLLVTGAGFEMKDEHAGFGLPHTRDLLGTMQEPFEAVSDVDKADLNPLRDRDAPIQMLYKKSQSKANDEFAGRKEPGEEQSFPVPISGKYSKRLTSHSRFKNAASQKNLDVYWDLILEANANISIYEPIERPEEKEKARKLEYAMRSSFRDSIILRDWGHLRQCLLAADMRWHSWLSTNYTRFADRAIALVKARSASSCNSRGTKGQTNGFHWRSVGTANEAREVNRELFHHETSTADSSFESQQYFFKLHGDVSYLQSMAVAGHDKEIYNGLTVPIDSLHDIYQAAENYLLRSTRRSQRLVWHIVGHGLKDVLLLRLISRVLKLSPVATRMDFVVVQPGRAAGAACRKLSEELRKKFRQYFGHVDNDSERRDQLNSRLAGLRFYFVETTAQQYISRLYRFGGLREDGIDSWLKNDLQAKNA